jgi:hypothetical protein
MTDSERPILTRVTFRTEILVKPVHLVCSRRAGAGDEPAAMRRRQSEGVFHAASAASLASRPAAARPPRRRIPVVETGGHRSRSHRAGNAGDRCRLHHRRQALGERHGARARRGDHGHGPGAGGRGGGRDPFGEPVRRATGGCGQRLPAGGQSLRLVGAAAGPDHHSLRPGGPGRRARPSGRGGPQGAVRRRGFRPDDPRPRHSPKRDARGRTRAGTARPRHLGLGDAERRRLPLHRHGRGCRDQGPDRAGAGGAAAGHQQWRRQRLGSGPRRRPGAPAGRDPAARGGLVRGQGRRRRDPDRGHDRVAGGARAHPRCRPRLDHRPGDRHHDRHRRPAGQPRGEGALGHRAAQGPRQRHGEDRRHGLFLHRRRRRPAGLRPAGGDGARRQRRLHHGRPHRRAAGRLAVQLERPPHARGR